MYKETGHKPRVPNKHEKGYHPADIFTNPAVETYGGDSAPDDVPAPEQAEDFS